MRRSCVIACSRSYFKPKRDRRLVRTHRFSLSASGGLAQHLGCGLARCLVQEFRHAIRIGGNRNREVPMNWPVILSGVVSVAALALGFNLLLPLGSGLEPVCVLTGVASAMVFFGLVEGA